MYIFVEKAGGFDEYPSSIAFILFDCCKPFLGLESKAAAKAAAAENAEGGSQD